MKGSQNGLGFVRLSFRKIRGTLFGVLIIRILLFRVLYEGPLFSKTRQTDLDHAAQVTCACTLPNT